MRFFSTAAEQSSLKDLEDGGVSSFYTTMNYFLDIFLCLRQVLFFPFLERSSHVSLVVRRGSYWQIARKIRLNISVMQITLILLELKK